MIGDEGGEGVRRGGHHKARNTQRNGEILFAMSAATLLAMRKMRQRILETMQHENCIGHAGVLFILTSVGTNHAVASSSPVLQLPSSERSA